MILSCLLASVLACSDDGDGRLNNRVANYLERQFIGQRSLSDASVPEYQSIRPIQWGDINFVHVTDTHGWLSGHPDQDPYSADWGDLTSFIEHLKRIGDEKGVDTVVIETGDRHDGTGLSDATTLDGQVSSPLLAQQPFDVISMGNHELYKQAVALQEYNLLRPYYGDHYLASNVELEINGTWVSAGKKYRKFHTKNKNIRILAFGFIFDFKGYDNGTRVIPVEEEIEKDWFKDAVSRTDEYDLILITGHMPVRDFDEMANIVKAIRKLNIHVPIQGFGGHTHLRDYRKLDWNAWALESGRYLETIGWASVNISQTQGEASGFNRRYIDFNPENFAHHTNTSLNATGDQLSFYTEKGTAISEEIAKSRQNLTLDTELAVVPHDYWTNRAPYPSNNSMFSLAELVMTELKGNVSRNDKPRYIITNTGNFRYDLLAGPYTLDKKFIVSPFDNSWQYIKDVPKKIADGVLDHLNKDYGYLRKRDFNWNSWKRSDGLSESESIIPPVPSASATPIVPAAGKSTVYKGYVTTDDAGTDGDDTVHEAYEFYESPNAVQGAQNVDSSSETVDVIFVSFLKKDIAFFIEKQGGPTQVQEYGGRIMRDLIEDYLKNNDNN